MRRSRLVYAVVLIPSLVGLVAYVLIKGLAYWRNPELLGVSPVAVTLNLGKLGLVLIGAFMALKQLRFHFGRVTHLDENRLSISGPAPGPQSFEDRLRAAPTGIDRKPVLGAALVAVLFAMPVLMVALANGGSLSAAPMRMLIALVLIEVVIAAVVLKTLMRVRRIRQHDVVNRPRE